MRIVHIVGGAILLLLSGFVPPAASAQAQAQAPAIQLDRDAGAWKTWIIPSGKEFRVPPPPDRGVTEKEAVEVSKLAAMRDNSALDTIAYWDTGAPSYRWSELATAGYLKQGPPWHQTAPARA